MVSFRAKFDSELRDIHTSYLDLQRGNSDRVYPIHSEALRGGPVSLRLQFDDDLAGIEARGFRTEWVEGDLARGDVDLADLEAVASHPAVIQLEYGGGFQLLLETSAAEINARGPGKVWTVNMSTGAFSGFRGAGVLVGVIDTGIDFTHPVFRKPGSTNTTRIQRIWDMGIDPHDGFTSPNVSLLQGNSTYGVEYTDKMINDVLQKVQGAKPVKHKDCHGHGTHVASVAAGDGRAERAKKKYEFVGVAPAADLIIVKMLYLQKEPTVGLERRFEDAVTYIERVAKNRLNDRPVVINASIGWNIGPHDGLGGGDRFLENRFVGTSKKAIVCAAGNDGGMRQHGLIVLPASGQIDVPFTLYDERHVDTDRSHCDPRQNAKPEMVIEFWYRPPSQGAPKLTSSLRPPKGPAVTGPSLPSTLSGKYPTNRRFMMTHEADTASRPPLLQVTRNVLRIKFSMRNNSYGAGAFTLRLSGPAGTKIHAWADQFFPTHGIRIGHDKPNSHNESDWTKRLVTLPTGITVPNTTTINSPASSNGAIAVANYDDGTGQLSSDSSQGPLADYSLLGAYAAKPDVAAPGFKITAANGTKSFMSALAKLGRQPGGAYATFSGTSFATPHVAGVAALMFEKKPTLALVDLVKQLEGKARAATPKEQFGEGKVDAKASHDAV